MAVTRNARWITPVLVAVLMLGLSGCTVGPSLSGTVGGQPSSAAAHGLKAPQLAIATVQPWNRPLMFRLVAGTMTVVHVTAGSPRRDLPGTVQAGGVAWRSTMLPTPGARYDVAVVAASRGKTSHLSAVVTVMAEPATAQMAYWVTPGSSWTVGVNAPIVIRFRYPVTLRAAAERALHVASTARVVGAWHWISPWEVHFRPKAAWPAHASVRLTADLAGVQLSDARYGEYDETVSFTVGDAHLTIVNGRTHQLSVVVNGRTRYTWPTSLGRPQFATRTGNYIVLEQTPSLRMTSCSAKITCDKTNPNWYDLTVQWDTRITWSGTFIHAAPWSVSHQGVANVSHGCINLSTSHAQTYYKLAQYGDLVTVTGTARGPADLLASGDPGMADWNLTWTQWLAGSALRAPITTTSI